MNYISLLNNSNFRAEEAALELKKLHGRLLDYNSMLDKMHSTSEMSVLEMEASDLKTKADQVDWNTVWENTISITGSQIIGGIIQREETTR